MFESSTNVHAQIYTGWQIRYHSDTEWYSAVIPQIACCCLNKMTDSKLANLNTWTTVELPSFRHAVDYYHGVASHSVHRHAVVDCPMTQTRLNCVRSESFKPELLLKFLADPEHISDGTMHRSADEFSNALLSTVSSSSRHEDPPDRPRRCKDVEHAMPARKVRV